MARGPTVSASPVVLSAAFASADRSAMPIQQAAYRPRIMRLGRTFHRLASASHVGAASTAMLRIALVRSAVMRIGPSSPKCSEEIARSLIRQTSADFRVTPKIAEADELNANLPLSAAGFGFASSLGTDRSRSLDVALMRVGRLTSTRRIVPRIELAGRCGGATHVVRRAIPTRRSIRPGAPGERKVED